MRIQYLGVGLFLVACSSKTVDQSQLPNENVTGNQGTGGAGGMTTPSDASSQQHPTPTGPLPDASPEASSSPDEGGASTPLTNQSEWTWRGGDLGSNYHNTNETKISVDNAARLKELWTYTGQDVINNFPVVTGGQVFSLDQSSLAALDTDGHVLWSTTKILGMSAPTVSGDVLYVLDYFEKLHALDLKNQGKEMWSVQVDPDHNARGFSSPHVFEKYIIMGSTSTEESVATANAKFHGAMVAYDKDTGAELWRHSTVTAPNNGATVWSSPAIDPDARLVFGATGNNYTESGTDTSDAIFALKVDTGELVWNTQVSAGDIYTTLTGKNPDADFGANPILFEATINGARRKLVGAGQKSGVFTALDRMTGDKVWAAAISKGSALIGGMLNNGAFDGERILVAGNNGTSNGPGSEPSNGESQNHGTSRLAALNPADGSIVWERQLPAWVWSPISVANGVGFVTTEKHLQAFDTKTGKKLATWDAAGTIASGAAIADGRVYFGSGLNYYVGVADKTLHCLALP